MRKILFKIIALALILALVFDPAMANVGWRNRDGGSLNQSEIPNSHSQIYAQQAIPAALIQGFDAIRGFGKRALTSSTRRAAASAAIVTSPIIADIRRDYEDEENLPAYKLDPDIPGSHWRFKAELDRKYRFKKRIEAAAPRVQNAGRSAAAYPVWSEAIQIKLGRALQYHNNPFVKFKHFLLSLDPAEETTLRLNVPLNTIEKFLVQLIKELGEPQPVQRTASHAKMDTTLVISKSHAILTKLKKTILQLPQLRKPIWLQSPNADPQSSVEALGLPEPLVTALRSQFGIYTMAQLLVSDPKKIEAFQGVGTSGLNDIKRAAAASGFLIEGDTVRAVRLIIRDQPYMLPSPGEETLRAFIATWQRHPVLRNFWPGNAVIEINGFPVADLSTPINRQRTISLKIPPRPPALSQAQRGIGLTESMLSLAALLLLLLLGHALLRVPGMVGPHLWPTLFMGAGVIGMVMGGGKDNLARLQGLRRTASAPRPREVIPLLPSVTHSDVSDVQFADTLMWALSLPHETPGDKERMEKTVLDVLIGRMPSDVTQAVWKKLLDEGETSVIALALSDIRVHNKDFSSSFLTAVLPGVIGRLKTMSENIETIQIELSLIEILEYRPSDAVLEPVWAALLGEGAMHLFGGMVKKALQVLALKYPRAELLGQLLPDLLTRPWDDFQFDIRDQVQKQILEMTRQQVWHKDLQTVWERLLSESVISSVRETAEAVLKSISGVPEDFLYAHDPVRMRQRNNQSIEFMIQLMRMVPSHQNTATVGIGIPGHGIVVNLEGYEGVSLALLDDVLHFLQLNEDAVITSVRKGVRTIDGSPKRFPLIEISIGRYAESRTSNEVLKSTLVEKAVSYAWANRSDIFITLHANRLAEIKMSDIRVIGIFGARFEELKRIPIRLFFEPEFKNQAGSAVYMFPVRLMRNGYALEKDHAGIYLVPPRIYAEQASLLMQDWDNERKSEKNPRQIEKQRLETEKLAASTLTLVTVQVHGALQKQLSGRHEIPVLIKGLPYASEIEAALKLKWKRLEAMRWRLFINDNEEREPNFLVMPGLDRLEIVPPSKKKKHERGIGLTESMLGLAALLLLLGHELFRLPGVMGPQLWHMLAIAAGGLVGALAVSADRPAPAKGDVRINSPLLVTLAAALAALLLWPSPVRAAAQVTGQNLAPAVVSSGNAGAFAALADRLPREESKKERDRIVGEIARILNAADPDARAEMFHTLLALEEQAAQGGKSKARELNHLVDANKSLATGRVAATGLLRVFLHAERGQHGVALTRAMYYLWYSLKSGSEVPLTDAEAPAAIEALFRVIKTDRDRAMLGASIVEALPIELVLDPGKAYLEEKGSSSISDPVVERIRRKIYPELKGKSMLAPQSKRLAEAA